MRFFISGFELFDSGLEIGIEIFNSGFPVGDQELLSYMVSEIGVLVIKFRKNTCSCSQLFEIFLRSSAHERYVEDMSGMTERKNNPSNPARASVTPQLIENYVIEKLQNFFGS